MRPRWARCSGVSLDELATGPPGMPEAPRSGPPRGGCSLRCPPADGHVPPAGSPASGPSTGLRRAIRQRPPPYEGLAGCAGPPCPPLRRLALLHQRNCEQSTAALEQVCERLELAQPQPASLLDRPAG